MILDFFSYSLQEGKVEDIYAMYYSDIAQDVYTEIISADPTTPVKDGSAQKLGAYSKWLLTLYRSKRLKTEDLYKATEYLTLFDMHKVQLKRDGAETDITRYKTLPELFNVVRGLPQSHKPKGAVTDETELVTNRYYIDRGEAKIVHEDDSCFLVEINSLEASKFYGTGSEWCTQNPDMYKHYSDMSPLYILIFKQTLNHVSDPERRLQLHFSSLQFMDMSDLALQGRLPVESKVLHKWFATKKVEAMIEGNMEYSDFDYAESDAGYYLWLLDEEECSLLDSDLLERFAFYIVVDNNEYYFDIPPYLYDLLSRKAQRKLLQKLSEGNDAMVHRLFPALSNEDKREYTVALYNYIIKNQDTEYVDGNVLPEDSIRFLNPEQVKIYLEYKRQEDFLTEEEMEYMSMEDRQEYADEEYNSTLFKSIIPKHIIKYVTAPDAANQPPVSKGRYGS
jgi:hypothetical protein